MRVASEPVRVDRASFTSALTHKTRTAPHALQAELPEGLQRSSTQTRPVGIKWAGLSCRMNEVAHTILDLTVLPALNTVSAVLMDRSCGGQFARFGLLSFLSHAEIPSLGCV